jgi:hypothetical protein
MAMYAKVHGCGYNLRKRAFTGAFEGRAKYYFFNERSNTNERRGEIGNLGESVS